MSLGIDYFYRNHPLANIQAKASLKTRAKMYQWISEKLGGIQGLKVLDHGSTPDTERLDSNCFIKWFIHDGAITYASSPEDINHLTQTIPQLTVIDWKELEAPDLKFDFIMSSAVIEHVGSDDNQLCYISNLLSHAKDICITTPNRYHWLEFHTKLPLIHWLPKKTHRSILKLLGFKFWAQEQNLNLLSEKKIINFIDQLNYSGLHLTYSVYKPKFLGMTSNLVFLIYSA